MVAAEPCIDISGVTIPVEGPPRAKLPCHWLIVILRQLGHVNIKMLVRRKHIRDQTNCTKHGINSSGDLMDMEDKAALCSLC